MRFLMIGISIVIGIILVGVVFSVTTDLTQPKEVEKIVEFEILTNVGGEGDVTVGTYEKFILYSNQFPLVIVDILINDVSIENSTYFLDFSSGSIIISKDGTTNSEVFIELYENNTFLGYDYEFSVNDIVEIVFTVEETQITSTSAILIALIPLLFATGVILYAYNTTLRGREE